MKFNRPLVQQFYNLSLDRAPRLPENLRKLYAVVITYDVFLQTEGMESANTRELHDVLASPQLSATMDQWASLMPEVPEPVIATVTR